jgi:putative membrane protein
MDQDQSTEDPRPRLAYDRTLLANERTYAAWLRTGLAVAAVGLAVAHLAEVWEPKRLSPRVLGALFVVVGVAVLAFGAWRFNRVNENLKLAGSPRTAVPPAVAYAVTAVVGALLFGVLLLF